MSQLQYFWTFMAICSAIVIIAELVVPARKLPYQRVIPIDALAFAAYQIIIYPVAVGITDPAFGGYHVPPDLLRAAVPLPVRLVMFYLLADLGSYWMHRLQHTHWIWRVHKFHHSPTAMWWLAGARTTIPQQIFFNIPYLIFIPILSGAPRWLYLAIMAEGVFRNHWMHMNVAWRSNRIEWLFVTPRYHHIHHSAEPRHHDSNFGSLFSIWDRLFGTYSDPDAGAPAELGLGLAPTERPQDLKARVVHTARLVVGI